MTLSRNMLLLLPCTAILLQPAAVDEVEASQCLPSAAAVRQEHPGAWPSWTMQRPDHKGEKCWFPSSREAHGRPIDGGRDYVATEPRRSAEHHRQGSDRASDRASDNGLPTMVDETDLLGLSMRPKMAQIDLIATEDAEVSFDERFAAAFETSPLPWSPIIRRMVDAGRQVP